jgi:hypothetical protein
LSGTLPVDSPYQVVINHCGECRKNTITTDKGVMALDDDDVQDESISASKIIEGHGSFLDADTLYGHEATAFALEGSYVKLQQETPGAQQQGDLNVSDTWLFGGSLGIARGDGRL